MAPGDMAIEADEGGRHAVERGTHDVQLARNRHMRLIKPLGAFPGEVRVSEQHGLAGLRRLARKRIHVAADWQAALQRELLAVGCDRGCCLAG